MADVSEERIDHVERLARRLLVDLEREGVDPSISMASMILASACLARCGTGDEITWARLAAQAWDATDPDCQCDGCQAKRGMVN